MVTRGGGGGMGRWSVGTEWQFCRMSKSKDSMVTIVNRIVSNTGNLLRE